MKRLFLTITALLMFVATMSAGGKLTLPDITSGKFAAKTVNGINPIEGTDTYARISQAFARRKANAHPDQDGAHLSPLVQGRLLHL